MRHAIGWHWNKVETINTGIKDKKIIDQNMKMKHISDKINITLLNTLRS